MLFTTGILEIFRYIRVALFKRPCLTVLCYHRITVNSFLLSPQCIPPIDFEKQLMFFKKNYDIWSLNEVKQYLDGDKELSRDTVSFTFDDGYIDNYSIAHKLLINNNINGAFFISSVPMLCREQYWLDELSQILLYLDSINIEVLEGLQSSLEDLLIKYLNASITDKHQAAKKVFLYLNTLSELEKQSSLRALKNLAKIPENEIRRSDTTIMDVNQAIQMQYEGHTIGAHSMTHPKFANLDEQELCDEICNSIRLFQEHGLSIRYFAYPFGKMNDIGDKLTLIKAKLKEQGIKLAFTTEDKIVQRSADCYFVPRKVMSSQSISQINLKLEMLAWTKS